MGSFKETLLFLFLSTFVLTESIGQSLIQSGPMTGYSSAKEVGIWIQTKEVANVKICYKITSIIDSTHCTSTLVSSKEDYLINKFVIGDLQPGQTYKYDIYINGKKQLLNYPATFTTQPIWKWRTDAPDFDFVAGSCTYVSDAQFDRPGIPYGAEYEIFTHINADQPDFMVWLGDNTYLREADWDSESGIYYRNKHTRSLKELQPLLSRTHHYAIWDDHDYGPNDSEGSYYLKEVTKKAFNDFWFNQVSGVGETNGITSFFSWMDCDFFLLDNRWYRTPKDSLEGEILGDKQRKWLMNALSKSQASFKFICVGGQFVSDATIFENHANYDDEKSQIIEGITRLGIKNIVFLTGDRHHSEISRMQTDNGIVIHDITSSPMTSGAYDHSDEPNSHRIEGSMIGQRNYAFLKVSGSGIERKVSVTFKGSKGKELYSYVILKEE